MAAPPPRPARSSTSNLSELQSSGGLNKPPPPSRLGRAPLVDDKKEAPPATPPKPMQKLDSSPAVLAEAARKMRPVSCKPNPAQLGVQPATPTMSTLKTSQSPNSSQSRRPVSCRPPGSNNLEERTSQPVNQQALLQRNVNTSLPSSQKLPLAPRPTVNPPNTRRSNSRRGNNPSAVKSVLAERPAVPERASPIINRSQRSVSIIQEDDAPNILDTLKEEDKAGDTETSVARSFICLDQTSFVEQIKQEEIIERRMSMVRKTLPLPAPPPAAKPTNKEVVTENVTATSPPPSPLPSLPSLPSLPQLSSGPPSNPPPMSPGIPKVYNDRLSSVFFEFLKQELEYAARLKSLINGMLNPIREKQILSSFQIVSLFSTVEKVVELSSEIITSIESILNTSQSELEVYARVADVFLQRQDKFSSYVNFCSNLPSIQQRISTYQQESQSFKQLLHDWERTNSISFQELLHQPKDRLLSYCSQLKKLSENVIAISDLPETTRTKLSHFQNDFTQLNEINMISQIITQIACGGDFYLLLDEQHNVYRSDHSSAQWKQLVFPTSSIISWIVAGDNMAAAVDQDGILFMWGTLPDQNVVLQPLMITFFDQQGMPQPGVVLDLVLSSTFAFFILENMLGGKNEVWVWGKAEKGQLGLGAEVHVANTPTLLTTFTDKQIVHITTSNTLAAALSQSGGVYVWGDSSVLALFPFGAAGDYSEPTLVDAIGDLNIVTICCTDKSIYAVNEQGDVFVWGINGSSALQNTTNDSRGAGQHQPLTAFVEYTVHNISYSPAVDRCFALTDNGELLSWTSASTVLDRIPAFSLCEVFHFDCSFSGSHIALHSSTLPDRTLTLLDSAVHLLSDQSAVINEQIKQVENITKLLEIDISITNSKEFNVVNQSHVFIMQGDVKIGSSDGHAFLFDDSILLCKRLKDKKKYEALQMIELNATSCVFGKNFPDPKFAFEIRDTSKSKYLVLEFASKGEKELWYARLQQQILENVEIDVAASVNISENGPPSQLPSLPPSALPALPSDTNKPKSRMSKLQIPIFSSKSIQKSPASSSSSSLSASTTDKKAPSLSPRILSESSPVVVSTSPRALTPLAIVENKPLPTAPFRKPIPAPPTSPTPTPTPPPVLKRDPTNPSLDVTRNRGSPLPTGPPAGKLDASNKQLSTENLAGKESYYRNEYAKERKLRRDAEDKLNDIRNLLQLSHHDDIIPHLQDLLQKLERQ